MNVPLMDLKKQYSSIKHEILPTISDLLESTQYVLGKEVTAFEEEFAAYCGADGCCGKHRHKRAAPLAVGRWRWTWR